MVIDYSQTVNRFTHLDAYPLPRIDELINEIAKSKYYSTVDLKSAYYQVPLATKDRKFTAFEANGKLYQHCRMPFGVTNGVSTFQRIIDNLIEKYKLKKTYAYLDKGFSNFFVVQYNPILKNKFLCNLYMCRPILR